MAELGKLFNRRSPFSLGTWPLLEWPGHSFGHWHMSGVRAATSGSAHQHCPSGPYCRPGAGRHHWSLECKRAGRGGVISRRLRVLMPM